MSCLKYLKYYIDHHHQPVAVRSTWLLIKQLITANYYLGNIYFACYWSKGVEVVEILSMSAEEDFFLQTIMSWSVPMWLLASSKTSSDMHDLPPKKYILNSRVWTQDEVSKRRKQMVLKGKKYTYKYICMKAPTGCPWWI